VSKEARKEIRGRGGEVIQRKGRNTNGGRENGYGGDQRRKQRMENGHEKKVVGEEGTSIKMERENRKRNKRGKSGVGEKGAR